MVGGIIHAFMMSCSIYVSCDTGPVPGDLDWEWNREVCLLLIFGHLRLKYYKAVQDCSQCGNFFAAKSAGTQDLEG